MLLILKEQKQKKKKKWKNKENMKPYTGLINWTICGVLRKKKK